MRLWLTPDVFNTLAITIAEYRWKLLLWSLLAFVLFTLLELQIASTTPMLLIWLTVFILFAGLQSLVFSVFIFFFQELPSSKIQDKSWFNFYRSIEWCETILFGFILPLPTCLFIYALIII